MSLISERVTPHRIVSYNKSQMIHSPTFQLSGKLLRSNSYDKFESGVYDGNMSEYNLNNLGAMNINLINHFTLDVPKSGGESPKNNYQQAEGQVENYIDLIVVFGDEILCVSVNN